MVAFRIFDVGEEPSALLTMDDPLRLVAEEACVPQPPQVGPEAEGDLLLGAHGTSLAALDLDDRFR